MKISLVYLHVVAKSDPNAPDPSYYEKYTKRFCDTYRQYRPKIQHELIVCCCGGKSSSEVDKFYSSMMTKYECYLGQGWDIGAYQSVAQSLDSDWMVCLATPVHFVRADWLEKIVNAINQFGDGLYGPMASYENSPHIRTSCFACKPERFREYPHLINTRDRDRLFESCEWNFTRWFQQKGLPTKMVASDGIYDHPQWRTPPNIFRRGDQSNCLVWDRHNDIYASVSDQDKRQLERMADAK